MPLAPLAHWANYLPDWFLNCLNQPSRRDIPCRSLVYRRRLLAIPIFLLLLMPQLLSVLLVDDDATTNYLNQLLLNRLQIAQHLLVAENGAEALATFQRACQAPGPSCPALILLDVNMPVMNGIEFLEAYQQLPPPLRQATVVVLLTTSVSPRDLDRVRHLPIAGTISKPLTEAKLRMILQQHFSD